MDEFNPYQTPRSQIAELEQKPSRPLAQATYRWVHFIYSALAILVLIALINTGKAQLSGIGIAAMFFIGLPLVNLGMTFSPKGLQIILIIISTIFFLFFCAGSLIAFSSSKTFPTPALFIFAINGLSLLWTYQQARSST